MRHAIKPATIMLAILALSVLMAGNVLAYEVRAFDGKSRKAKVADFTPHVDSKENKVNKFFSEQYSFDSNTEDGGNLWFQIFFSNMGMKNGRAALLVNFTPPGGKKVTTRQLFDAGKWSHSVESGKLTITLGKSTFSGDGMVWNAHLVTKEFVADTTITNTVPAWRPGGGMAYYGKGKKSYFGVTLLTPRGRFEATVKSDTAGEHALTGLTYGDHSVINIPPNLQSHRWVKLRKVGKRKTVMLTVLETSEEYGNKWVGWFVVAGDKRIEATGTNPILELSDLKKDPKNGYEVPQSVLITGATGVDSLMGAIKVKKLKKRRDKLAGLSTLERAVVSKLVQPVSYSHRSLFEFQYKRGEKVKKVKGRTNYYFEQTTK
jgi:hypothetical protein